MMKKRSQDTSRSSTCNPDEKGAYSSLGHLYWGSGDREKALAHFNKVIEINPLDKSTYNTLAYLYEAMGDFEESIWAINQYISVAPDEANPYDTRGDLFAFNGRIDAAINSYRKAVEQKRDFGGSLEKLGHMYLFKQDYARAETFYRELVESADAHHRAWGRYCLALIPMRQGAWSEALEVLRRGIAADELEGFRRLGYWWKQAAEADVYAEMNDLDQAVATYERFLRNLTNDYPNSPAIGGFKDVYVYFLVRNGEVSRAIEIANAMNEDSDKNTWSYWWRKGWIEQGQGNMDAGCTSLEKSATYWGKGFRVRYELALAYLKAGRLAEAVDAFERVVKRFDQNRALQPVHAVKAHYHLGVAYEQSGWNDKAIEQYEEFLDIWKDADPGIEEVEDAARRLAALSEKAERP